MPVCVVRVGYINILENFIWNINSNLKSWYKVSNMKIFKYHKSNDLAIMNPNMEWDILNVILLQFIRTNYRKMEKQDQFV